MGGTLKTVLCFGGRRHTLAPGDRRLQQPLHEAATDNQAPSRPGRHHHGYASILVLGHCIYCLAELGPFKAMGINEYKRQKQRMQIDNSIQSFLDRFYMSRIGIRMLIGQHVALNSMPENDDEYVGIICTRTNVKDLAQEAIENARFVCEDYYGLFDAPKVQLVCRPDLHFMYVPGHLSHMLFETLKNSLRAVVETHGSDSEDFPPIKVIVADGKEVRCGAADSLGDTNDAGVK